MWIYVVLFPPFGLNANKKMCSFLHCPELCYQYFQVLLFCVPEGDEVCQLFLKLIFNNFIIIVQRIEINLSLKRTRSWDSEINIIVQNRSETISTGNKTHMISNWKHENGKISLAWYWCSQEIFLNLDWGL